MIITTNSWKKLFLFCLGLAAAAAFCMKWMETDLWSGGERYTILGLELFYDKEKLLKVLSGLPESGKTILRYHLTFDFAFMAGVYPGISALCIMAANKAGKDRKSFLQKLLLILASLQLLAWAADITENYYLFSWISNPQIGSEFSFYHFVVIFKWFVALAGVFVSVPLVLWRRKKAL
jgi:hypothetical protein